MLGDDAGIKQDTYIIGNKGFEIWIEKLKTKNKIGTVTIHGSFRVIFIG